MDVYTGPRSQKTSEITLVSATVNWTIREESNTPRIAQHRAV